MTDGIVTRSDVIDQLINILLFILSRCYAIIIVLVLDVNEPSGYQGVTTQVSLAMFIDVKYLFI